MAMLLGRTGLGSLLERRERHPTKKLKKIPEQEALLFASVNDNNQIDLILRSYHELKKDSTGNKFILSRIASPRSANSCAKPGM